MVNKESNLGYQLHLKGKRAEQFVQELAKKSFLEDWCYNNPLLPNGKEWCDLLVVYDSVAIIWQIKDLKIDDQGKYKLSEVQKNIRQAVTAKNRMFRKEFVIELENPRRGKELFQSQNIEEVYLISALLGEGEDFFSFIEEYKGNLIHIFTRDFTEIILNELNTIEDFIDYFRKKEELISWKKNIIITGGEEELLAYYLMNERSFDIFKEPGMLTFTEGIWDELQQRPEYVAKKKEDEISYLWDSIIDSAHLSNGEYEVVARELARTNRFNRRVLSKAFYEAHVLAHNEQIKNSFRRIVPFDGVTYCFLFYDKTEDSDYRQKLLGSICFVARGIFSDNDQVIGIATEMKISNFLSYDFCLLEIPDWTEENQREMERIQQELGIFTNYRQKRMREDEYPQ